MFGKSVNWDSRTNTVSINNSDDISEDERYIPEGGCITNEETALRIGKAILEEHFPDMFKNNELRFVAQEKDGIWTVNNVIEDRVKELPDGTIIITLGGEVYVKFRKSTGEVIKIGVND